MNFDRVIAYWDPLSYSSTSTKVWMTRLILQMDQHRSHQLMKMVRLKITLHQERITSTMIMASSEVSQTMIHLLISKRKKLKKRAPRYCSMPIISRQGAHSTRAYLCRDSTLECPCWIQLHPSSLRLLPQVTSLDFSCIQCLTHSLIQTRTFTRTTWASWRSQSNSSTRKATAWTYRVSTEQRVAKQVDPLPEARSSRSATLCRAAYSRAVTSVKMTTMR